MKHFLFLLLVVSNDLACESCQTEKTKTEQVTPPKKMTIPTFNRILLIIMWQNR